MGRPRVFRPRKRFPKEDLEKYLEEGMKLEDIADIYGVSTSYISEYLNYIGLKVPEKNRYIKREKKPFLEVFWSKIKNEIK